MIDIERYEDAMFEVREMPIPMPTGNGDGLFLPSSGDSQFKMIVRADTEGIDTELTPISIMSKDYRLITNRELLEAALPLIDQYGGVVPSPNNRADIEINRVFGNARSQFAFDFPHVEVMVGKDVVHPRITMVNSYDGTKRVGFKYGAYRLVCSNGLTIGSYSAETYMHIGKNTPLNDLESIIRNVFDNMESTIGQGFAPMLEKTIEVVKINKFVDIFPKQFRADVLGQLKDNNAWSVYNAGTFVTSHLMDRSNESTHTLEREIYKFVMANAA